MRVILVLFLLIAGCAEYTPPEVRACEDYLMAKLKAPATYKRVGFSSAATDGIQHVSIEYDAANSYGVPLRETQLCAFPIKDGQPDVAYRDHDRDIEIEADRLMDEAIALAERIEAEAEAKAAAAPRGKSVDLCWHDYCPCEPPQGGPDQSLCRQLKAGIGVAPELMSEAAALRDARQELDDLE